jgi:general secretion pathway protein G
VVSLDMTRNARGFTLIELLVVMAVIGLLLSVAAPRYMHQVDHSRDVVLRHNLDGLRQAIDQFYSDKGRYPKALQELVDMRYLRSVPVDPITERNDTWIMVPPAGDPGPAWFDVRSGARGAGDDGTSYATW